MCLVIVNIHVFTVTGHSQLSIFSSSRQKIAEILTIPEMTQFIYFVQQISGEIDPCIYRLSSAACVLGNIYECM